MKTFALHGGSVRIATGASARQEQRGERIKDRPESPPHSTILHQASAKRSNVLTETAQPGVAKD